MQGFEIILFELRGDGLCCIEIVPTCKSSGSWRLSLTLVALGFVSVARGDTSAVSSGIWCRSCFLGLVAIGYATVVASGNLRSMFVFILNGSECCSVFLGNACNGGKFSMATASMAAQGESGFSLVSLETSTFSSVAPGNDSSAVSPVSVANGYSSVSLVASSAPHGYGSVARELLSSACLSLASSTICLRFSRLSFCLWRWTSTIVLYTYKITTVQVGPGGGDQSWTFVTLGHRRMLGLSAWSRPLAHSNLSLSHFRFVSCPRFPRSELRTPQGQENECLQKCAILFCLKFAWFSTT